MFEYLMNELNKIDGSDIKSVYRLMNYIDGLLKDAYNDVYKTLDITQNPKYHKYNVRDHIAVSVLEAAKDNADSEIKLVMLLHDVGKGISHTVGDDILDHFYNHAEYSCKITKCLLVDTLGMKEDDTFVREVINLIKYHDTFADYVHTIKMSKIRRMCSLYGYEFMYKLLKVMKYDMLAQSDSLREIKSAYISKLYAKIYTCKCDGTAYGVEDLDIKKKDLQELGWNGELNSDDSIVDILLRSVWGQPSCNKKDTLISIAKHEIKKKRNKNK